MNMDRDEEMVEIVIKHEPLFDVTCLPRDANLDSMTATLCDNKAAGECSLPSPTLEKEQYQTYTDSIYSGSREARLHNFQIFTNETFGTGASVSINSLKVENKYEEESVSGGSVCEATVKQEYTDIEKQSESQTRMFGSKQKIGIDGTSSPRKLHLIKTEDGKMQCLNCMSAVLDVDGHHIYCSKNLSATLCKPSKVFEHSISGPTSDVGDTHKGDKFPDSTAFVITNEVTKSEQPKDKVQFTCKSVAQEEWMECSKCNLYFNDRSTYLDHKRFTCEKLENGENIANDQRNITAENDEDLCIKVEKLDQSPGAEGIRDHIFDHEHHKQGSEIIRHSPGMDVAGFVDRTFEMFTFSCRHCKSIFNDSSALDVHKRSCKGSKKAPCKKITCPICSRVLKTRFEYSQHLVSSHILKKMEQGQKRKFSETGNTSDGYTTYLEAGTKQTANGMAQYLKNLKEQGQKDNQINVTTYTCFKRSKNIATLQGHNDRETEMSKAGFVSDHKMQFVVVNKKIGKGKSIIRTLYSCSRCSKEFSQRDEVSRHVTENHPQLLKKCSKMFSQHEEVSSHITENHPQLLKKCSKTFSQREEVSSHITENHPQLFKKSRRENCGDTVYKKSRWENCEDTVYKKSRWENCEDTVYKKSRRENCGPIVYKKCRWENCGATFYTEAALKSHIQIHLVNQCQLCEYTCRSPRELVTHLSENHTGVVIVKNPS